MTTDTYPEHLEQAAWGRDDPPPAAHVGATPAERLLIIERQLRAADVDEAEAAVAWLSAIVKQRRAQERSRRS